jgi:HAD superfamily hydrolase (TIGR01509 family)
MDDPHLQPPRAVIFDLGNTLALPDWPRITFVTQRVAHLSARAEELQSRLCQVLTEADRSEDFLRDIAGRRLAPGWEFRNLYRGLGLDGVHLDELLAALMDEHDRQHLWSVPNGDALPVLDELKGRGLKLAVISNSPDGRVEELIELLGMSGYFDSVTDSYHAGYAKPDTRIFMQAVGRLGVGPTDAAYVGDSYAQDVAGAQNAGLKGILYDPLDLQPVLNVIRVHSLRELTRTWGE